MAGHIVILLKTQAMSNTHRISNIIVFFGSQTLVTMVIESLLHAHVYVVTKSREMLIQVHLHCIYSKYIRI